MKHWIEINIKLSSEILENCSGFFFDLGADGLEEKEDGFNVYFSAEKWNKTVQSQIETWISGSGFAESNASETMSIKKMAEENWMENWKHNFKSFKLTENIVIKPDWEERNKNSNETVITIAPKMAFGTGHHETTQLLLEQMEGEDFIDKRVLDAGCGSGILAIYAAYKKAELITAFDFDPIAIENLKENITLNDFQNNIEYFIGEIDHIRYEKYDYILANINKNVLMSSAAKFRKRLANNGKLFLSGLLNTDFENIREQYRNENWSIRSKHKKNEWIAIVLEQNESRKTITTDLSFSNP
jgi:ribosomal protein L11 methyltransferase